MKTDTCDLLASAREMASWGQLRKMHPHVTIETHDRIIDRLIELDCMRPAWAELAKATSKREQRPGAIAFGFLSTCIDAFLAYKLVTLRPDASHRHHYSKISTAARELMQQIEEDIELRTWANTATTPRGALADDLIDFASRCGLSERDAVEIGMAGLHFAPGRTPSLLQLLSDLATHAEDLRDAGPLSKRPNKANSHEIYFVRRISAWLREELSAPLHAVTACAANALFASDMDAERAAKLASEKW